MTGMTEALTPLYFGRRSINGKTWKLRTADEREVTTLRQRLDLPQTICEMLGARGFSAETAPSFLAPTLKELMPDPSHLLDMDKAVDRIVRALQAKEKIVVFGDYDVDGATSSALLRRYFREIGHPISVYIPDRIDEGYGPNAPALQLLQRQGHTLTLMVDCGTTAFEALTAAADCSLDVIVIDHHTAQPTLPPAVAIINPNRLDENSPLGNLCAAGVAFMLLVALHRRLRVLGWFDGKVEPDLRENLDLVALGTVCDVMPLTGLNRAFVTQGLKVMRQRRNIGLTALSDVAALTEAPTAYHLGFILGPRINAGGRVGKATLGTNLLTTEDFVEARAIARELDHYNKERQEIEGVVTQEAYTQIDDLNLSDNPVIIVRGKDWHPGVIGIVASRIKEKYSRPVCVVSFDQGVGKGSGRSISGVHLGAAMHAAQQSGLLVNGGGHAMAAGFTVTDDLYPQFHTFLQERLKEHVANAEPTLEVDAILAPSGATASLLETFSLFEPFGAGNPTPKFVLQYVRIPYAEKIGVNHLRCQVQGQDGTRIKAMAFRALDTQMGQALLSNRHQLYHAAGTLKLDTWNGQRTVAFFLEDLMPIEGE